MSAWSKVGEIVASVAPVLGAAVGGPVGAVAGAAGSLIASWLGVDEDPAAVEKVLKANPDALLKLKELESQERLRLIEWQAQQLQASLQDVQSARNREIELAKAGHKAAWGTSIVASLILTGFLGATGAVVGFDVFGVMDHRFSEATMLLIGNLSTGFSTVVGYYLGGMRAAKDTPSQVKVNAAMLTQ